MHAVKVNAGSKVVSIWVKDEPGITSSVVGSEPGYHPEQFDPRKTSPFANKQFSTAGFHYNQSAELSQSRFPVSSSPFVTTKADNVESTFQTFANSPDAKPIDLGKSYATRADAEVGELYLGASRSNELAKKEVAFNGDVRLSASALANKSFGDQDRKAHPQDDFDALKRAVAGRMRDVPNRPLNIDEVKALINHEVQPNLDTPAQDQSKALNDPAYQEIPTPAPPARPAVSVIMAPSTAPNRDTGLLPGPGEVAEGVTEGGPLPAPTPAK